MAWKKTILIGGIQGEGVASTGINLMKSLAGIGYYVYGERKFSSRIKGGNTHIVMTISNEPVTCVGSQLDLLLAFDNESIEGNGHLLCSQGVMLVDDTLALDDSMVPLPLTKLAQEHGSLFMKNTCAIGFLGKMLEIDYLVLEESIIKTYHRKGEQVVDDNVKVLKAAYGYLVKGLKEAIGLPKIQGEKKALMMLTGNEAIALGALMAGCRFVAAYPITPASDVMEIMSRTLPQEQGLMVQTEDEVAAVTMCIGASYAGVRSMTSTSGPGLTLMMEGLGLAGMTETPLVVLDAQRAGPSTGLPTRTEQSDIASLYHAGHGEYPMIMLSPSTMEECYQLTIQAFEMSEMYQCPVMIMSDFHLSLSPQVISAMTYEPVPINRGFVAKEEDLVQEGTDTFPRYALTDSGISPRSFPGMKGGMHKVTGLEHTITGRPSDEAKNRIQMMDKRSRKTEPLIKQEAIHIEERGSELLCLTFGSNWGVLQTAVEEHDLAIDTARISRLLPLPLIQLQKLSMVYKKIVVMEQNKGGQLAAIIKEVLCTEDQIVNYTKYNGEAFRVTEVAEQLGRWCDMWK